jgi:CYTH domain-containing protein
MMKSQAPPLEIERVFLLDRLPNLPPGAVALRIEQGYLPEECDDQVGIEHFREGRIRRITRPDGSVACVHTIKRGAGLVRTEIEQPMTPEQFEQIWPRTIGRRIAKTRHKIKHGDLVWEVDQFHDLSLVLAEVELPRADVEVTLPPWLAPHVVREVTDEPEYRNFALATKSQQVDKSTSRNPDG